MWKVSNVFGLRTSRNPQNHKSCQYRQTWGQPRSVTLDDLWMVMMQCQMSDVVMCWPKSCKLSPFQSMAAFTWLKTRFPRKISRRLLLLWRHSSVTWPDPIIFLRKVEQRMPHQLCIFSAWSAKQRGGHLRETHKGFKHTPTPPHTGEG